jgi:hypothetical protein
VGNSPNKEERISIPEEENATEKQQKETVVT